MQDSFFTPDPLPIRKDGFCKLPFKVSESFYVTTKSILRANLYSEFSEPMSRGDISPEWLESYFYSKSSASRIIARIYLSESPFDTLSSAISQDNSSSSNLTLLLRFEELFQLFLISQCLAIVLCKFSSCGNCGCVILFF